MEKFSILELINYFRISGDSKQVILCKFLKPARGIQQRFAHERRHARGAVDAQQVGRQVDSGVTRPKVHLNKKENKEKLLVIMEHSNNQLLSPLNLALKVLSSCRIPLY